MIEKKIIVQNRAGIHARPATLIAQKANEFSSDIAILRDEKKYNAKSVIGVMTMTASYNTELTLQINGEDEAEAVEAISLLFDNKFEEDE
ncbi:MAG: phosphocarrier protein HPr [Treponema sp.]|nr:MAG: phosphocarrier protein HPr [Treponema sp.]